MPKVVELNHLEELNHYRMAWRSLVGQTQGATLFHTLEWLETYWNHFGAGQRLRVIMVEHQGMPVGILPLVVRRERTRIGSVRVLTYPLHDWGTFYSPLGPNPTATLLAGLRHIYETRRDWEMLDLRWINPDQDRGRTPRAMQSVGFQVRPSVWKQTALVDTNQSWEAYLASRTSKIRSNLKRCERRVLELGDIEFLRHRPQGSAYGDDNPRWDLFDECVELARRTWQGSSTDGTTLSHESVHAFLREAHALAARHGHLDLNAIRVNGRVAAFGYNYCASGYVLGMRIGYDPEFAKAGLGKILYAWTFRDSCRRGDHTFDMGPGSLDIKREWLTRVATSHRYTHYGRNSLRCHVLRCKHWFVRNTQTLSSANGAMPQASSV